MKKYLISETMLNGQISNSISLKSSKSLEDKYYRQVILIRGIHRRQILAWVKISKINARHVRTCHGVLEPGEIALIGVGLYFEPFFTKEARGMCFSECAHAKKEKDLKPLAEYLRSTGRQV